MITRDDVLLELSLDAWYGFIAGRVPEGFAFDVDGAVVLDSWDYASPRYIGDAS